ncbi:MAG: methylmalonyl Co-A mutase-associated GTPase MeaB [Verrucomicrobiales bacterium]|nr:methylmalonyl Co-A mutase-associated GTPase MeaB [Verrucomicrobiales bacterium]
MESPNQPQPRADATSRRGELAVEEYVEGVRAGNRAILGRAITLIESTSSRHEAKAQEMLQQLLPFTGGARRVGITGVPGVGKSTFIEALGLHLCHRGRRVAVLAIDPTSTLSRGSILGDKTRMERLSGEPAAFIRPSPSGGSLGGVARRTRESMLVCEAAGFDVVLVETVGVGQSEVALRSMVDYFLLLLLPGAGDDLQGIKRGIMEMADAVLVNKADGDNRARAELARGEQTMALHTMAPATPGWQVRVMLGSGLTGEGIDSLWASVEEFYAQLGPSGVLRSRRAAQSRQWLDDLVREELQRRLERHPGVRTLRPELERAVAAGEITAVRAARMVLEAFDKLPDVRRLAEGPTRGEQTHS